MRITWYSMSVDSDSCGAAVVRAAENAQAEMRRLATAACALLAG